MITSQAFQQLNIRDQSDAVGKLRVSNPQALIDTDFEYGLQGTKWEILETMNGYTAQGYRPSEPAYAGIADTGQGILSIVGSPNQLALGGTKPNGTLRVTVRQPPIKPFQKLDPISVKFTGAGATWSTITDSSGIITDVINLSTFEYRSNVSGKVTAATNTFTNLASENTIIYLGQWLTGSLIPVSNLTLMANSCSARVTLAYGNHNFVPGMQITLMSNISTNDVRYPWCGNFSVDSFDTGTTGQFNTFYVNTLSSAFPGTDTTIVNSIVNGLSCVVNPTGYVVHRFTDGGVQLIPGASFVTWFNSACAQTANLNNIPTQNSLIRQTRKYFRYQSGKSLQFSTGVVFRPTYDVISWFGSTGYLIDGVSSSVLLLQLDTDTNIVGTHERINNQGNASTFVRAPFWKNATRIRISGFVNDNFTPDGASVNGEYRAIFPISTNTIILSASRNFSNLNGLPRIEILDWYDANVRTGLFDDMNGVFWEYDGQSLNVVRRNSTKRMAGRMASNFTASFFTTSLGTSRIAKEVYPADTIVLRGAPYIVNAADSFATDFATTGTMSPYYRGPSTGNNIQACVVDELRVPQKDFNLDKLDGTGPSGYIIDLNKMQMVFIDYSWYGAGKIRFGIRGTDGNIIWCHEMPNNNINSEAYLRSGNLPARFESNTNAKPLTLAIEPNGSPTGASPILRETLTFPLCVLATQASYLPASGRILFNRELWGYRKVGQLSTSQFLLSVIQRYLPGGFSQPAGTGTFPFSYPTGPDRRGLSWNHNCSPGVSHWGTSVIMDGGFDTDKSYLFTAASLSAVIVPPGQDFPLVSIRLAPSVDFGIPGFYGIRSIINRSQLTLDSFGVAVAGGVGQITLRLNPIMSSFARLSGWQNVLGGSIAQYFDHSALEFGGRVPSTGGELVGAFFSQNTSDASFNVTTQSIATTRELGNSILGGNFVHPDGPDVLTISIRNIGTQLNTITAFGRLTWTESQG